MYRLCGSDLRCAGQTLHRRSEGEDRVPAWWHHRNRRDPGRGFSAILVGFNVRADASARKVIESESLDLRYYSVIPMTIIDEVKQAMSGKLAPEYRQEIIGLALKCVASSSPKFRRRCWLYGYRRCGQAFQPHSRSA